MSQQDVETALAIIKSNTMKYRRTIPAANYLLRIEDFAGVVRGVGAAMMGFLMFRRVG